MTTATVTSVTLSPTITQSSLADSIADSLVAVGFTLHSSYTASSVQYRVMKLIMSADTKGTIYLRVGINSTPGITIYDYWETWNAGTNTGTGNTTNISLSTLAGSIYPVYITRISHPEAKYIVIEINTIQGVIGLLRPKGTPPSWWDEDTYPYFFGLQKTLSNSLAVSCSLVNTSSPYGTNITLPYFALSSMQDANPYDSNSRAILPFVVQSGNGQNVGIINSCEDVVITASNGLRCLDTLTVSESEIYTYVFPNLTSNGLAIRTT